MPVMRQNPYLLVGLASVLLLGCASTPEPREEPLDADPPIAVASGKAKGNPALDRGIAFIKAGKFAEAMEQLKAALEADPERAEGSFYMALALEQTGGDRAEAERLYKQALVLDGTLVEAAGNLAALYLEEPPRLDEAVAVLQKGLKVDPENANLNASLGYALGRKGDADGASKAYELAIKKDPKPELSFAYGVMLAENKRAEQAGPHLLAASKAYQDDVATLATIARLLGPGKAYADCVRLLDRAIDLKPGHAELLVRRGVCKHELKKEKEASADFEAAIKADAKFQPAHYYLGLSLLEQGNGVRGKQSLKKAIELGKDTPIGKLAQEKLDATKPGAKKK